MEQFVAGSRVEVVAVGDDHFGQVGWVDARYEWDADHVFVLLPNEEGPLAYERHELVPIESSTDGPPPSPRNNQIPSPWARSATQRPVNTQTGHVSPPPSIDSDMDDFTDGGDSGAMQSPSPQSPSRFTGSQVALKVSQRWTRMPLVGRMAVTVAPILLIVLIVSLATLHSDSYRAGQELGRHYVTNLQDHGSSVLPDDVRQTCHLLALNGASLITGVHWSEGVIDHRDFDANDFLHGCLDSGLGARG